MPRLYSFIVPVYNRPGELAELLNSLAHQSFNRFEVVIIEDGSSIRSDYLANEFAKRMAMQYLDLPRSGPSLARNAGARAAKGDYFLFVDSDCILPPDYLMNIDAFLENNPLDFFGGPDRAAENFTRTQKAISYAMTSFLTTGGIRGGKKKVDRFYPRSFNMAVSRHAFETVGGFPITRMHPGEDMVFSIELIKQGFGSGLIRDAAVYHKRRATVGKFFKQVFGFGKTRYLISKVYPDTFQLFYLAPSAFLMGSLALIVLCFLLGWWCLLPLIAWILMVWIDASLKNSSPITGSLAIITSFIQLYGYGCGFIHSWWKVGILHQDLYGISNQGFYPDRSVNQ